jgi:nitroreductase
MNDNAEILLKLATQRKTVRVFKQERPPNTDIRCVLETACQAPSGSNKQPWHFLIIDDPTVKAQVREAAEEGEKTFYDTISPKRRMAYKAMGNSWQKPMLENAPILIVVVSDMSSPNFKPSVWLLVGYLVLALEAAGIGSVTYTPSNSQKVADVLKIPDGYQLESILPIGYSDDPKKKSLRKTLETVTFKNQWGESFK